MNPWRGFRFCLAAKPPSGRAARQNSAGPLVLSCAKKVAKIPSWIALAFIRIYQIALSPLLGPKCRFEPSCSCYAALCIERFGLLRGAWLGLRRILRCHPLGPWGYDPPPEVQGSPTLPSAHLFRKSFK